MPCSIRLIFDPFGARVPLAILSFRQSQCKVPRLTPYKILKYKGYLPVVDVHQCCVSGTVDAEDEGKA
jgi:hypothetical protein